MVFAMSFDLKSVKIEHIFIFAALAIFLYVGPGTILNHRITHDLPYGYFASDAYGELAFAEWFNMHGKMDVLPHYIRFGHTNSMAFHMPVFYAENAMLSNFTGFETYEGAILPYLFVILASLVMYLIARQFNTNVAILGLSVTVFLFLQRFVISWLWGNWDLALAMVFLAAAFWWIDRHDLEHYYAYLGIFVAGVLITHTSEAAFLVLFYALYYVFKLAKREMSMQETRWIVYSGIIGIALSFGYLLVFYHGHWQGSQWTLSQIRPENFDVTFRNFRWAVFPIVAGAIASAYFALKKNHYAALPALFMLAIGFGNYFGFHSRAFQVRYSWPIFMGLFLGLSIYLVLKLLLKKLKTVYAAALSIALCFIFLASAGYQDSSNPGLMDPYHWEMIRWLPSQTPENARIFFMYGDLYNQDAALWIDQRQNYVAEIPQLIEAIQNRSIKRLYYAEFVGASDAFAVRKSFFQFEYPGLAGLKGYTDICSFDYLVFDKGSGQQVFAQYNLLVASELVKKEWMKPVFNNDLVVILHNEKPGEDCIEEQNF